MSTRRRVLAIAGLVVLANFVLPGVGWAEDPEAAEASGSAEISEAAELGEAEEITESEELPEAKAVVDAAGMGPDIAVVREGERRGGASIDEITVTATRRSESVQDVPISVTALGGDFIEEMGITDFAAVQKFTPNLQILPQSDSRSTSIRIRGIGSVGNNAGIDPSVAVFIDDVYQGRAGMSVQDLLDIERIEVLRGPQGTLYGKNTAAGAIRVATRRPQHDNSSTFELVTGDYSDIEGRFSANLSLIPDVLATRFSGYGVKRDGYDELQNTRGFAGLPPDMNAVQKWGIRNRTLWDVNDSLSFLLSGDFSKQDDNCCAADIMEYGTTAPFPLRPATFIAGFHGVTLPPENPRDRKVDLDVAPRNKVTVGGVSLEGTLDWVEHTITLLTSYRNYGTDSFFDGDFSALNAITWPTKANLDQTSTELRIVSPSDDLFEYVGGLYFFYGSLETDDVLSFEQEYMEAVFGTSQLQSSTNTNHHQTTSFAGYGQATVGLQELWGGERQLSLTGGLRVDWEKKQREGCWVSEGILTVLGLETPLSGPNYCYGPAPAGTPPPVAELASQERNVTNLQGRLDLRYWPFESWGPIDSFMLYGSIANGFKSGGFTQLRTGGAALDPNVTEFNDERSLTYEAGIRTTWLDRMLTFNITGFYTDYNDFQAQVFDGRGITTENAAKFESYGFEADLVLGLAPRDMLPHDTSGLFVVLTPDLWINTVNVGYNKTRFLDYPNGPCRGDDIVTNPPIPPCYNAGPNGEPWQDLTGRTLDNSPEFNLSFVSTFENDLRVVPASFYTTFDYQYTSSQFLNASLDPKLKQGPVNLMGIRVGFRHADQIWDVSMWIRNLADESWFVVGFDVPTMGGRAVFVAPPRTIGGTFRLKF